MCKAYEVIMRVVRRIAWAVSWWVGHILQALFFLPIKKNRILFTAGDGWRYDCNPRAISEYLAKSGADVELLWGFFRPGKYRDMPGIRAVRIFSPAWLYFSATASVIVTNAAVHRAQPKRKGQLIVETWHGGGAYKGEGTGDRSGDRGAERRIRDEYVRKIDLFASSSRAFTENTIRREFGYAGEVLPCGMPRNDLFFDETQRTAAAKKVRALYDLTGFVALYAPTFRGKFWLGCSLEDTFPYEKVLTALRQRFGGPVTMLRRAHPGGRMVGGVAPGVIDVSDYPDMQELLLAADLLITDYSSSIWDYALLGRPCLLYVPDMESYIAQRGICSPITEWPGIACGDERALLDALATLNARDCAMKAEQHLKALGSYETGTATAQICERILRHTGCASSVRGEMEGGRIWRKLMEDT